MEKKLALLPVALLLGTLYGCGGGDTKTIRPEPYPLYNFKADASFGTASTTASSYINWGDYQAGDSVSHDVAALPDGSYLTTGVVTFNAPVAGRFLFVAKYLADGQLDASFGDKGIKKLKRTDSAGKKIQVLADGKILVAVENDGELDVIRLKANGDLDTTYGDAGWFHYLGQKLEKPVAMLPEATGKVYVVGDGGTALRLTADGALDATWATSGVSTDMFTQANELSSATLQSDGKLVVGGRLALTGSHGYAILGRFDTTGKLDTAYGSEATGVVKYAFDNKVWANFTSLEKDAANNITAAGLVCIHSIGMCDDALVKFNSVGAVDATFGTAGAVITHWDLPDTKIPVTLTDTVRDSAGRITTLSAIRIPYKVTEDYNLLVTVTATARYLPDGSPDLSFGKDGKRVVYNDGDGVHGEPTFQMKSMVLDDNGKYVLTGVRNKALTQPAVMRQLP